MKLLHWLIAPPPAGLGMELRSNQVVLARFGEKRGRRELDLCLKAPVPPGVIELSMLEPNLKEPEGLAGFLRQLLDQAGHLRGVRANGSDNQFHEKSTGYRKSFRPGPANC